MTRKRVFITGVTGYIGRSVACHLADRGWECHGLIRGRHSVRRIPEEHRDSIEFHRASQTVRGLAKILERVAPEAVLHLAAQSSVDGPGEHITSLIHSNVLLSGKLFEAMSMSGVRKIVPASTYWQHADGAQYSPRSRYAATKQAAEDLLRFYTDVDGFSAVALVLTDVFGPADDRNKFYRLLLERGIKRAPVRASPGAQLVDLVHVSDVARAFERALARVVGAAPGKFERFSVSSDAPLTLRALHSLVESIRGERLRVSFGARPYRPREMFSRWSVAPRLPGWRARIALRAGLAECLRDHRSRSSAK